MLSPTCLRSSLRSRRTTVRRPSLVTQAILARTLPLLLLIPLLTACLPADPTRTGPGETASVASVVDGDTVELADGHRVRYIGIDTPERDRPYAADATALNRSLVEGQDVWLETDAQPTDQYGRLLAYVWAGDTFVNLELVRQGYATAFTVPPNVRHADAFVQAEREAREAGRGLWAPAGVPIRITALNYDAPGADHLAPNGEWVELTNQGDTPVDLSGYTLRDERSHLYTFGPVVLAPNATLRLHSGRGADTAARLYWGLANDAVWNNDGDTAYLRDAAGTFVDAYTYSP
jgi:endonuclease YncB( thermonuclease family)